MKLVQNTGLLILVFIFLSCGNSEQPSALSGKDSDSAATCMMVPSRFGNGSVDSSLQFSGDTSVTGMVFIKGGTFLMGGDNDQASPDE